MFDVHILTFFIVALTSRIVISQSPAESLKGAPAVETEINVSLPPLSHGLLGFGSIGFRNERIPVPQEVPKIPQDVPDAPLPFGLGSISFPKDEDEFTQDVLHSASKKKQLPLGLGFFGFPKDRVEVPLDVPKISQDEPVTQLPLGFDFTGFPKDRVEIPQEMLNNPEIIGPLGLGSIYFPQDRVPVPQISSRSFEVEPKLQLAHQHRLKPKIHIGHRHSDDLGLRVSLKHVILDFLNRMKIFKGVTKTLRKSLKIQNLINILHVFLDKLLHELDIDNEIVYN